jgi:bacterioferritin (cytochrome b1)
MLIQIMAQEEEHADDMSDLLGCRPGRDTNRGAIP